VGSVRIGAQRASLQQPRIALVIAAALLASALGVAATAAAPTPALAASRWHDVETYYLRLVNCTRTGGWVQSDGDCIDYGSGKHSKYVAPLKLSDGISGVARDWAKYLARHNECRHGDPGARLRKAGFNWSAYGENIGCNNYDKARRAVLKSHLAFQAEKSSDGGHWKNIKNETYRKIGIGVWRDNGRTRLVTDFYRG
jgi:CubicO group peptidase (beta-lactamase class C family)